MLRSRTPLHLLEDIPPVIYNKLELEINIYEVSFVNIKEESSVKKRGSLYNILKVIQDN